MCTEENDINKNPSFSLNSPFTIFILVIFAAKLSNYFQISKRIFANSFFLVTFVPEMKRMPITVRLGYILHDAQNWVHL